MSNNFVRIRINKPLVKDSFDAFMVLLWECFHDISVENFHEEFKEHGFISFSSGRGEGGLKYWINLDFEKSENLFPIAEEIGGESLATEVVATLLAAARGDDVSINTTATKMFPEAASIVDKAFETTGMERSPTAPEWSIAPHIGRQALVRPTTPELELL
jgi:hypothetical protein